MGNAISNPGREKRVLIGGKLRRGHGTDLNAVVHYPYLKGRGWGGGGGVWGGVRRAGESSIGEETFKKRNLGYYTHDKFLSV